MKVDYKKGKIFQITAKFAKLKFIGCTCEKTLSRRFEAMKRQFKWTDEKCGKLDIILIGEYSCKNKDQLNARVFYWANKLENSSNSVSEFYYSIYIKCFCGTEFKLNNKVDHLRYAFHRNYISVIEDKQIFKQFIESKFDITRNYKDTSSNKVLYQICHENNFDISYMQMKLLLFELRIKDKRTSKGKVFIGIKIKQQVNKMEQFILKKLQPLIEIERELKALNII